SMNIHKFLEVSGYTIQRLAKQVGLTQQTISRIMRGEDFSFSSLIQICEKTMGIITLEEIEKEWKRIREEREKELLSFPSKETDHVEGEQTIDKARKKHPSKKGRKKKQKNRIEQQLSMNYTPDENDSSYEQSV